MFIIEDIIWLETIVEKLAWKHHVLPAEVEEVLRSSQCKIYRKEKLFLIMDWGPKMNVQGL